MTTVSTPIDVGVALTQNNYITLFELAADGINQSACVNVRFSSRDLADLANIRLANVPSAYVDGTTSPTNAEWLLPLTLAIGTGGVASGFYEDKGLVVKPGRKLVAYSDKAIVTARVHGYARKTVV